MNCVWKRAVAALLVLVSQLAVADDHPVTTVPNVDLERYLGRWYEIGSFPMFFQRHCIGETTADYALQEGGSISVRNRCRSEDGFIEAEGRATPVADSGNARLKVSFFWPFSSDYWIIGLDDAYRWAVVGNPNRKYLWILSRTPVLDAAALEQARTIAAAQGFDLAQLRMTRQLAE